MKTHLLFLHSAILLIFVAAGNVFADVKIKTRSTSGGSSSEHTTYIKGKRQRTELGDYSVSVMQCDMRRSIELVPATKTYQINSFVSDETQNSAVANFGGGKATRGGNVTTTITTKDTGERKMMFGFNARRILTTMETKSAPDACSPQNSKMEIESWVIDAEFALSCDLANQKIGFVPPSEKGCQDKYVFKNVGTAKSGFQLWSKMTMYDENGKPAHSSISEVVELSKATLDAALFEIPAGYTESKNPAEMSAQNNRGDEEYTAKPNNSGFGSNVQKAAQASGNQTTEVGAKKSGVIRLGLASVKVGAVGEGLNAADLAGAVQNTLTEYLKMPNVEVVSLEAKLPSAIAAEATEKSCDFVIYANVSHKKGGGGMFGGMLGKMSEVVSRQAIGSSDTVGKVTQVSIMSAAAASGSVKSKDQITLEIKINAANNSTAATKQFQAKAKSDGADIITPLIEQAAELIAVTTAKK